MKGTPAAPGDRFATLTFQRRVKAPAATLWQAWLSPAARAVWSAPSPEVSVDIIEADPRTGGRELSVCKVAGQPDIHVETGWMHLQAPHHSVNYERVSSGGAAQSVALVTAEIAGDGDDSRIDLTVQLSSIARDMAADYRQGFAAGLANLGGVAERTMVLQRVIKAPLPVIWGAWMNPDALPEWWGPDGFTCRTGRIDLRPGGEWVFDMIAPDGTVFPNHHKYGRIVEGQGFDYTLHWGENGPKHADAWAGFEDIGGATRVTLGMVFATQDEFDTARGFGAEELGLQTLGKLAAHIGEK
ncbi:MAG: SRPBCC domain-containing protein [Rhodobacteraceae bacterium]|nr:SRPBCC domain-containing protein [Paracoccaceae bacterium]